MTNQHKADAALQQWQSLRALPPDERIEVLMAEFFAPSIQPCDVEYEATLRNVAMEMAHV